MRHLRNSKILKPIALVLVFSLLLQLGLPLRSFALTGGPAQPEFSSFEPVSTVKMVDEFTGDLTYNLPVLEIPGPEGSSYPLSLSYHSGASPEEDASWVGYGWSLNPGAIMRGKAGYADDFDGEEVIEYNRVPDNITASLGANYGGEIFGFDGLNLGLNASIRYNNYRGFGYVAGANLGVNGYGSLGYSISDGEGAFSMRLSAGGLLSKLKDETNSTQGEQPNAKASDVTSPSSPANAKKVIFKFKVDLRGGPVKSKYGFSLPGKEIRPTTVTPFTGRSYNYSTSIQGNPILPIGFQTGFRGNYTRQKNVDRNLLRSYGYMYSQNAGEDDLMDYYLERETPFEIHDRYLAIPFSSPDNFSATGEALSGGFRLHDRRVPHFHPNKAKSRTIIAQLGPEFMVGGDFGPGYDVGVGYNEVTVKGWNSVGLGFSGLEDEGKFFKFTGDQGGHIELGDQRAKRAETALINTNTDPDYGLGFGNGVPLAMNSGERVGRSSYIGYHTNAEMLESNGSHPTKAYTKEQVLLNSTFVNRGSLPKGLGELAITNEGGATYLYGLPVYSRREHQLSYMVHENPATNDYMLYGAYTKDDAEYVVGRENPAPYASQFLLTEIRTPDYVDRTLNGPSEDDFGGYTHFQYERIVGSSDKNASTGWYKWRIPYNGLNYTANQMSDNMDNMGAVSYGEKEVYYLNRIDTRTHYAVFELNDPINDPRLDALDAEANEAIAAASNTSQGVHHQRRLDHIKLYKKGGPGQPDLLLTTVNFQYDYSAFGTGIPNPVPNQPYLSSLPNSAGQNGKLTLRRVWFDYEGIVNARISPYEFHYEYPRNTSSASSAFQANPSLGYNATGLQVPAPRTEVAYPNPAKYGSFENPGFWLDETPPYNPKDLDAWGNYQKGGVDRYLNQRTWVNQNPEKPDAQLGNLGFDPAAYQLKSITLPSGGQIHIQYEQDDYSWVQDRHAMAMVRLKPSSDDGTHIYHLDTETDLGLFPGDPKLEKIRQMIKELFVDGRERMYFKFLYALGASPAAINDCRSEFVDGYVSIESVVNGTSGIEITLGSTPGPFKFPKNVCNDWLRTVKAGNVLPGTNCVDPLSNSSSIAPQDLLLQLIGWVGNVATGSICGDISKGDSYFRIPVPSKLGGGIRVKRILMFDKGLEAGHEDAALYGTEYEYLDEFGQSSGVATHEPSSIVFEDPLRTLLDREDQTLINKIVAGRDKKEMEGPLGESMLPPASVGYQRVVAKSIHNGKTSPGYTVSKYLTCKQYPFDKRYGEVDSDPAFWHTSMNKAKRFLLPAIDGLPFSVSFDNRWLTQGYRFVQYDIYGQPESVAAYAGSYISGQTQPLESQLISLQRYTYYEPGESLPIMNDIDDIDQVGWYPGKEMEIVTESREVSDISIDGSLELDASIALGAIPMIFVTAAPNVAYSESRLKTHATTKIVRYPAIQKSVESYQDGIWHLTEPVAFDPQNGQPVLSRTTDGYDGLLLSNSSVAHNGQYHAYSIPGTRHYAALKQKATNERRILPKAGSGDVLTKTNLGGSTFLVYSNGNGGNGGDPCATMDALSAGSKVLVKGPSGILDGIYTLGGSNGGSVELLHSGFYSSNSTYFGPVTVEILESGNTNQLAQSLGGFTTYGPPASLTVSPPDQIVLNHRIQDIENPMNAWLQSQSGGVFELPLNNCEFLLSHSQHPKIRLSIQQALPNGNYLHIELVDVYNSSERVVCQDDIPGFVGGSFDIDVHTGELVFYANGIACHPRDIHCLKFCTNIAERRSLDSVVVAAAQTLSDNWPYDLAQYGNVQAGTPNVYETGEKGKWRGLSSYKFRKDIRDGGNYYANPGEKVFDFAGVFTLDLFNYENPSANAPEKWLCLNTVSKYSPFGQGLQEVDILGVASNAHYGYHNTVPTLVAQNASYDVCYFESFENVYNGAFLEEGVPLMPLSTFAHAGKASCEVSNSVNLRTFRFDQNTVNRGFSVQAWVRDETYLKTSLNGHLHSGSVNFPLQFKWQARTGEWDLYEAQIMPNIIWGGIVAGDLVTLVLSKGATTAPTIQVDDVRFQPLDSKMACYVYDVATLRLVCTFDDQHFGMYNQYTSEGKLVRKIIETERGMKTVQESQSHSPNQIRPQ